MREGRYNGTRLLKSGGETTELFLAHTGVSAHETAMGQDAGVGAGAAFPDGDGVSTGCWATEFRFPRRQSSANERAWWAVIIAGVPPVQRVWYKGEKSNA